MSAFENVLKLVRAWPCEPLPTELKYRDSLIAYLRENLPKAKIEREFRHLGTTTDVYVREEGFFGKSEVFLELKRNLLTKSVLDRLVGQIELLEPKEHPILVVLCGEIDPALLGRLRQDSDTRFQSQESIWRIA
jgi:hypothetical protein